MATQVVKNARTIIELEHPDDDPSTGNEEPTGEHDMDFVKRTAASGGSYLGLYLGLMLPTYFLPYLGSNSFIAQGVNADYANATGNSGIFFYFLIHLGCMIALAVLAKVRGSLIGKSWIVAFPIVALVFDFVPGLSLIPLIPTLLHFGAIFMGVSGKVGNPT